jgi:hypothetical protein
MPIRYPSANAWIVSYSELSRYPSVESLPTMVRMSSRPLEFEPFSSVGSLRAVKAAARRFRDGLRPALTPLRLLLR